MKTHQKLKLLALLPFLAFFSEAFAQDWPQYLGPERNGTSPQKGILRSWPESGPDVLWSADLGIGYGGAVTKDGRAYLLDRDDDVGDNLRCFDLDTGEELWNFAYDAPGSVMFPGSRSVPAIEGNSIYTCGAYGDLYCIDLNTQKPVWHKNIWTDFGGESGMVPPGQEGDNPRGFTVLENFPIWAITQCPLVYGDLLIVLSQAPEAGAVAYDKETGDVVWRTPYLGNESYASPSVVKIDGEDHLVFVISSTNPIGRRDLPQTLGKVVGVEPLSGKILWEYDQWECHISVPSAVDAGDNKVLVIGGYELGAVMLRVEKKADGTYGTTELFRTEEFGDQTKPPILIDGYFYAQYGTNNKRDGLTCMNMEGEIMWKTKRDPDFNKGSMIFADGLILATDGAKSLFLIEPDPSGFKALASSEVLSAAVESGDRMASRFGTQNWAPIALADGKLLIRDQSRLLCLKVVE